jgi:multidrug efflux system outer membrane protein
VKRLFAAALMVSVAGCSLEPPLAQTALPVPPSWPSGDPYLAASETPLPAVTYREIFADPRLQVLIGQALANNRDLRIAAANIAAARAQVRITRADRLPRVDASASASEGGKNSSSYSVGLIPSFDLDLFGRLASLSKADQQRLFSTEAAARATRIALVADIAQAWATYAADSSLLSIAERTVGSAETSVRLTGARLNGGIAPKTDLLQAQQVLETARADAALQRTARAQDANLLQLLAGAPVDPSLLPHSIEKVGGTFTPLAAGLDSRVLLRRPDVMQAEFDLRAANAEIGAARAALFPTISLTGLVGLASSALTGLFSGGAFAWSAGADARHSIFNAGAGRARVAQTEAQRNAALAGYEKAIQTAFREVADALAVRGTVGERLRASSANVDATAETLRLVDARYRGGIDTYLTTLDAQRSYYTAQRAQVAAELAKANAAISLYRALGADNLLNDAPVR